MRVLGRCPACGGQDTVYGVGIVLCDRMWNLRCRQCKECWSGFQTVEELIKTERKRGNELIRVSLSSSQLELPPKDEIPCWKSISFILNMALMVKFDLDPRFAPDGGLKGYFQGDFVEFESSDLCIGLGVPWSSPWTPAAEKILRWYERMLRHLFNLRLCSGSRFYPRGEILRVQDKKQAKEILWVMLLKIEGSAFVERVKEMIEELQTKGYNVIPYIIGPSPEY